MAIFSSGLKGWSGQIGVSEDTASEINVHLGAGLTWYDTFERDGENIGIVFTHLKTSSFQGPELPSKETTFEIFNKYILNDYI
jgi:porin